MNYGDVYVHINRICDPEKYIHLSKLDEALHYDHCMATISPQIRAQILQTLYVVIMCPISMELAKSSSYSFSFNMQASLAMDMSNLVHWLEDITWL